VAEPEVRIEDESGDTRLAGSVFAPAATPAGQTLVTTGTGGATGWQAGGGGGSLTVTDQTTSVPNVTTLEFIDGAVVFNGGAGDAQVQAGISRAIVPISSAQILDLKNTPVTLISGVAGSAIIVVNALLAYVAGLTPYLDGGGVIAVDAIGWGNGPWVSNPSSGFWDQATSQVIGNAGANAGLSVSGQLDGVAVSLTQSVASPTLGNGTLIVTVSYYLAPTA
jgi:hypothetical protein